MENTQKLNLLKEIYRSFYDNTNSFEPFGEQLSYLMGAVLEDDKCFFFIGDKSQKEMIDFINENFPKDHLIYNYFSIDEG